MPEREGSPPSADLPSLEAPRAGNLAPEPHSAEEIEAALRRPLRLVDLVLAAPQRIAANVERELALIPLALLFLLASVVCAIPYGCVLGSDSWWRVVVLYLGSTLICLPSLHVFSSYLGMRVSLPQILVLALTIPAVAALFTLGFAPILAFLRATMDASSEQVSWRTLSNALLAIALLAGIAQLWRSLLAAKGFRAHAGFVVVLLVWHGLFLHVLLRMADALGIPG